MAAKIYREPAAETAPALAERWWNEAGRSRQSLFHGGVREVGMGIAVDGDERLFVFVLATAPAPDALPPSLGDAAARRAAFLAGVNDLRASHGLSALYSDGALDRAAEDHATALLAALRAGRPLTTVAVLASRLGGDLAASQPVIHDVRSSGVHRQRGMLGHQKLDKAVGVAVVVDAMSAAEALATAAAAAEGGDLLTPGYRKLGLGVALDMTGETPHVVWVACLTGR